VKIAREAFPFVLGLLVAATIAGLAIHPIAALPIAFLVLFTLWFFRDPERTPPGDPDALVSPADGRIIEAGPERISIFMNVFDVHVCRVPIAGKIEEASHRPGRFLAAFTDEAPEQNEAVSILVSDRTRQVRFQLVAGLIARRIVCKVVPGQTVESGDRVGLIRFGSRVDVALPPDTQVNVKVGQRVRAGETTIGRLPPCFPI